MIKNRESAARSRARKQVAMLMAIIVLIQFLTIKCSSIFALIFQSKSSSVVHLLRTWFKIVSHSKSYLPSEILELTSI